MPTLIGEYVRFDVGVSSKKGWPHHLHVQLQKPGQRWWMGHEALDPRLVPCGSVGGFLLATGFLSPSSLRAPSSSAAHWPLAARASNHRVLIARLFATVVAVVVIIFSGLVSWLLAGENVGNSVDATASWVWAGKFRVGFVFFFLLNGYTYSWLQRIHKRFFLL